MLISLAQTVQSFPAREWPFLLGRPRFLLVHRTGSKSDRFECCDVPPDARPSSKHPCRAGRRHAPSETADPQPPPLNLNLRIKCRRVPCAREHEHATAGRDPYTHLGGEVAKKITRNPLELPGFKNFGAMRVETSGKPEKIVGKYFHSANETNKIEWQGVVIGQPHPAGIWCNCSNGVQGIQACKDLCQSKK